MKFEKCQTWKFLTAGLNYDYYYKFRCVQSRSSQTLELGPKYQQIMSRIKELSVKWQEYVNSHQEFHTRLEDCFNWLADVRSKLTYCSDLSASSQEDLDKKTATIHDLLMYKEEGFIKVEISLPLTILLECISLETKSCRISYHKLMVKYDRT